MERAAHINALVKALNTAAADDDHLLQVAAKLASTPWLAQRWQFRLKSEPGYPSRLVADWKGFRVPVDVDSFIHDVLALATDDPAKRQAALQAFAPIKEYCHLCEEGDAHG